MTEQEHSFGWAETALRYLDALDTGDVVALAELWEKAADNPVLAMTLGELTDGLAIEEGVTPSWETDAARVRSLLQQHLLSGFSEKITPLPLTVRDVAARLLTDSTLVARWTEADRAANSRLLADPTPLPDELGLPHFEEWQSTLGVHASARYWRAFRQAAVLLAMGRCQQAVELAAARRAGRVPRGGRS